MYLQHKSSLPFCYYDKAKDKIVLRLICDNKIANVKVIYGDPFMYVKTEKLNEHGENIWEWKYSEAELNLQLIADNKIMWQAELTSPKTRRVKYAFVVTNARGEEFYYSENGTELFSHESANTPHNHFFIPFIHYIDAINVPEWASNICWYQIFPERFCNGDSSISPEEIEDWETGTPKPRNFFGGDLRGIIEKLPYLCELGITGIYLTPVFLSPSNHKYDIQDYFETDPHFGNKQTLKELVAKAHALGMKVMLDAVFNHIGSKHVFWQDVLKNQENSKYKNYFHIHSFPVKETYANREDLNFDAFAFVPSMPKWNTENPEARKYLIDAATYWVKECDIDGWRLDVADEVSFDFWHDFRKAIAECKPDFYVLGEMWHDPSKWLNGKYFDAVMNYPLGRLIRDMFLTKTIDAEIFNRELARKLMQFSDIHSRVQFNLMDSHDTARVLTQANGDKQALKNAFLFMMFMKGAPCIYYGTEIGMDGKGDPDCRKPMVWNQSKQDTELFAFFKKLIALRKKFNSLVQNAKINFTNNNFCCWEFNHGTQKLCIIYNESEKEIPIEPEREILLSTWEEPKNMLPSNSAAIIL